MFDDNNLKNFNFPKMPFVLGFGGLIPFVFCVIIIVFDIDSSFDPAKILLYYGSVILSFVGAISWGFATKEKTENKLQQYLFLWSVLPALLAFLALVISQAESFLLLILGFLLAYLVDKKIQHKLSIPSWYIFLRLQLTIVVVICLCIGLTQDLF